MSDLLEFFFTGVVPTLKSNVVIDINELIEVWINSSPITLNYNRETFASDLPASILANLCSTYQNQPTFESHGLLALHSILKREVSENSIAQWCLCIHFTKLSDTEKHGSKLSYLLSHTNAMVVREPDQNHRQWIILAKNVIQHPTIQGIVDRNICKFGVEPKSYTDITVSIVSNSIQELRGFSGLDQIYVNSAYFEAKFVSSYINTVVQKLDTERVELAAKMSLIALVIHEYGHVKFRQANGSFNVSTPTKAKEKGLPDDSKEMGVSCEISTFGSHVDWNLSQFVADLDYMKSFIDAIESGSDLPEGSPGRIINRKPLEPIASGVDMDAELIIYE